MSMIYENILVEVRGSVRLITVNRPQALNAINAGVMSELNHFFTEHYGDISIRGVIITGSGEKAFVAGADIKAFGPLSSEEGAALAKFGHDTYAKIEGFHCPVIAAVNGFALGGGCELAMACHMRIAGAHAKFGQPEVNLGLIPGYGGTQRLVQYIGKNKAMELLLTADMIGADEAMRLGLVSHVVEAGQEIEKAMEILAKVETKGPLAVQKIIECVNAYFANDAAFEKEYLEFGFAIGTQDSKEGAQAFIEKRKPNFVGK